MKQITREMFEDVQSQALQRYLFQGEQLDIYRVLAAKAYGVSEDDVTPEMRQTAKNAAYRFAYFPGALSISWGNQVKKKMEDDRLFGIPTEKR